MTQKPRRSREKLLDPMHILIERTAAAVVCGVLAGLLGLSLILSELFTFIESAALGPYWWAVWFGPAIFGAVTGFVFGPRLVPLFESLLLRSRWH